MSELVDCRGLSCPHPVIQTKQALEGADAVTVIVDNPISRDNVLRFGESQGCEVNVDQKGDGIYIHMVKRMAKGTESNSLLSEAPVAGPVVLVIPNDQMGRGNQELGTILVRSFLHTLTDVSPRPDKMIFFNTGVKLTVEGSQVIEDLQTLGKDGVEILVCGTCLDFFGLKDKIAAGQVSNMYTIAETMLSAGRLVTL